MKKDYGTLQELIEEKKDLFKKSCDLFPCAPLAQSGYMLEDNFTVYPMARRIKKYYRGYLYVSDLLTVDLIMKKYNCIKPQYIPPIKKALKAVLAHSYEIPLEPDEWPVMMEIAKRINEGLPKMKIVPDGQEYKYFSYNTDD